MSFIKKLLTLLVVSFFLIVSALYYVDKVCAYATVNSRGEASTESEAQAIALKEATNACGIGNSLREYNIVRSECTINPNKCVVELVGICN